MAKYIKYAFFFLVFIFMIGVFFIGAYMKSIGLNLSDIDIRMFFFKPKHGIYHGSKLSQKKCFSNIRVIQGAVEIYNMDKSVPIRNLDDGVLKILINNKYLKEVSSTNCDECKYISNGDLSRDGVIFCKCHGSLDGKILMAENSGKTDKQIEFLGNLYNFGGIAIIAFILCFFIGCIMLFFYKPGKEETIDD